MLQVKPLKKKRAQSGFTLFEMVVVICSIAILYVVAEQRMNDLPAAAERANFRGVLEQIKTGVQFETFNRMSQGKTGSLHDMVGANPMDYLLEPPSNYLGELAQVTDAVRRRNAWYYEQDSGELVYVVGGSSIQDVRVVIATVPVNLGQIRFRIQSVYKNENNEMKIDGRDAITPDMDWEGVLLLPVHEYNWNDRVEDPAEVVLGGT